MFQKMSGEGDPNLSGPESESDEEPWQPNQEMLLALLEMGIPENAAKRVKFLFPNLHLMFDGNPI